MSISISICISSFAQTEYNKQTTFPKVSPHGATTKTLRGPQPDKDATMPADNPLVKSTRWQPKSPVKRAVVVTVKGLNKTVSGLEFSILHLFVERILTCLFCDRYLVVFCLLGMDSRVADLLPNCSFSKHP